MTDLTPSPTDRLTPTLEGMRADMVAEGRRKGPAGALASALLRLLEMILALLA